MNNQETENKELTPEQPKVRKRKLLTDPDKLWSKCKVCSEAGNLENMIRHGIPWKNSAGVELYGAFSYIYFCSENCKALFIIDEKMPKEKYLVK